MPTPVQRNEGLDLRAVQGKPLRQIPLTAADRVVRRVVDGERARRLEIAAFNSAP